MQTAVSSKPSGVPPGSGNGPEGFNGQKHAGGPQCPLAGLQPPLAPPGGIPPPVRALLNAGGASAPSGAGPPHETGPASRGRHQVNLRTSPGEDLANQSLNGMMDAIAEAPVALVAQGAPEGTHPSVVRAPMRQDAAAPVWTPAGGFR